MQIKNMTLLIAVIAVLSSCSSTRSDDRVVDAISKNVRVMYNIVSNHAADHGVDGAALGADWGLVNTAVIVLTNSGPAIPGREWKIYFSSIRRVLRVDNPAFTIDHINGDLYVLAPTEKFEGFKVGEAVSIPTVNEYWQVSRTDVMPRWFVVAGKAKPKVIANTDTEDLDQFVGPITGDNVKRVLTDKNVEMNPVTRFEVNADTPMLPSAAVRGRIIPTPLSVQIGETDVNLKTGVKLQLEGVSSEAVKVLSDRFVKLGVSATGSYPIEGKIVPASFTGEMQKSGAYTLSLTATGAKIEGYDEAGVFYGVQSILSLIPGVGDPVVATVTASDAPRFAYRGVHIDIARNFHSKQMMMRLLNQMAAYKLNKFHLHVSDDEGWRLEIPGLPELTTVGAKRAFDLSEKTSLIPQLGSGPNTNTNGSGYLTRSDFIELLKYAKARQIDIIPEFDIPGHARAAVISMEARYANLMKAGKKEAAEEYRLLDPEDTSNTTSVQFFDRTSCLNPALESSQRFVAKVVKEVYIMYGEAKVPLTVWAFGGDEAKNILVGGGFQDVNAPTKEPGKGIIDLSKQDHPWARSPAAQKLVASGAVRDVEELPTYFAVQVSKILKDSGINAMQAWQDGLKHAAAASDFAVTDSVAVNFWDTIFWGGSESVTDWMAKGFKVIVSNPDYVYFDFPHEVSPNERGYYWGARVNSERKAFTFAPDNFPQNAETSVDRDGMAFNSSASKPWPGVYGLQSQLWSETVRTDDQAEYMLYPRLLSLAERAWHRAGWELTYVQGREFRGGETSFVDKNAILTDWINFANTVGAVILPKLDKEGIGYRLSVPGARIDGGVLSANITFPGLSIEYSTGGDWMKYDPANKPTVTGTVKVRSVDSTGKRYGRVETVNS